MKRFIAIVAQQTKKYDACEYQPSPDAPGDFRFLPTRVPIVPVMNAVVERGETIQVILVSAKNAESQKGVLLNPNSPLKILDDAIERTQLELNKQDASSPERMKVEAPLNALIDALEEFKKPAFKRNLEYTCDEIETWANRNEIHADIRVIENNEPSTMKELLSLYKNLIQAVEKGYDSEDVFYADITFGTKPMTLLLMYVLRYIRAIKGNPVEHVVYGQVFWGQNRAELHELTSLFDMDFIVSLIGEMAVKDPTGIIKWSLDNAIGTEE